MKKPPPDNFIAPCFVNHCDGRFVLRKGRYGFFFGCSNWPACQSTRSVDSMADEYEHDEGFADSGPDDPDWEWSL